MSEASRAARPLAIVSVTVMHAAQRQTNVFSGSFLPTAAELPSFETERTETPSPVNSLQVKGVGEAGTIAATPAETGRTRRLYKSLRVLAACAVLAGLAGCAAPPPPSPVVTAPPPKPLDAKTQLENHM